MSYDPSDAAYDRFVDELYKEFRDSVLEDSELYDSVVDAFREARLRDYYLENPLVAQAAQAAVAEAETLALSNPRASLILAVVGTEVCLREALLTPILHGSFHTEASAEILVRIVVRSKDEKLVKALLRILAAHTEIDLQEFQRSGSSKPLWEEIHDIQKKRNRVIHQAESATSEEAASAIGIGRAVLTEVFARAVAKLGLHLHDQMRVCGSYKCTSP